MMGENLQLMFQLSLIVCLILSVKGQTEGFTCTDIQYVDVIPDCTFGCFCVSRQNAIPRIECREEPTSCLVSNECSDPEIPSGCKCPLCLQGRHCVALTEDQMTVKVPEGALNVPVGCAICSCQNIPTTSTFVNIISNKIDLGNIQPRDAECDYQLCPPTLNNGLDGEDGEDATVNGPGRDGLDGGQGFDVNSRRYPNCAVVDQSRTRDSEAAMLICDYGCFCNLDSGRTVCVIPPACSVSNRCSNPIEGPCGCPSCPVGQIGSCVAEGPSGEQVRISDDGTTLVGGCARCECEAVQAIDYPLFWRRDSSPPLLSQRKAICDYTACACAGVDASMRYATVDDIPTCTPGEFCIVSENRVVTVRACLVDNRCVNPVEDACGCPICPDIGNCLGSVNGQVQVIDDGAAHQQIGCAVCTCEAVSELVLYDDTQNTQPPTVPTRHAICDTSACPPENPCSNTDPSLVFPSSRDVPPCTFGCLCFTNDDVGLCIDAAPCDVTNKCVTPEFTCGCPSCPEVGNCIASVGGFFYLINDDGPKTVAGCAVCECNPVSNPVPFPGFLLPGNQPPTVQTREATCNVDSCNTGAGGSNGGGSSGSGGSTTPPGVNPTPPGGDATPPGGNTTPDDSGSGNPGVPSSCANKQCIISNKCTNPEPDECGCPTCNHGNCIAVSVSGQRYTIGERRHVVVDRCARCLCINNIANANFPNYREPGAQRPQLPERMASCDYNIC